MKNFIPVNTPLFSGNEKKYLMECIDSGWISSEGPFVEEFEKTFSKKVNRKFGVAVCNGTAALEVAVEALGLGSGSEVILPSFCIISCILAITRAGLTPVLVDCDPHTWNMDPNKIESKISSRTRAIMVVHTYGLPVDMAPILSIAQKHDLKIIEDAAQMHGQNYRNTPCGSFGDISIFSFYPNKHITTGEGGMVLTDDPKLKEKCQSLRNLCFEPERRFWHESLGFNYRMSNLQAAVGVAQLEQLDNFVKKKREMGAFYYNALKNIGSLQFPLPKTPYAENIYWVFGMVLKNPKIQMKDVIQKLSKMGIGTRPFFWPMHKQPVFQKMGWFEGESYPVSENLGLHGFYIPSGLGLAREDQDQVIDALQEVFKD
ncbi:MAG TPA: DegT/DnrJ/EryC1/StrS aminotransferase family protein [Gammaproteobacteria bacterium]|nr:DegT/DnrJ/EryC1/StrS aminotransferase family protein [Gammaproteobacteria bacterium]